MAGCTAVPEMLPFCCKLVSYWMNIVLVDRNVLQVDEFSVKLGIIGHRFHQQNLLMFVKLFRMHSCDNGLSVF